jgi:hypothetical protein
MYSGVARWLLLGGGGAFALEGMLTAAWRANTAQ